jgi:hypothetical protein
VDTISSPFGSGEGVSETVGKPGQLVQLAFGQAQGLAEVPDCPLHLISRDDAGEGGVLPAPFPVRPQDKFLPDAAREVEVNVRHIGHHIGREKPFQGQAVLQRVDVGKAYKIACQQGYR